MGYCDIEDKCKKCGEPINYSIYCDEDVDVWVDGDVVTCNNCGAKYKVEVDVVSSLELIEDKNE